MNRVGASKSQKAAKKKLREAAAREYAVAVEAQAFKEQAEGAQAQAEAAKAQADARRVLLEVTAREREAASRSHELVRAAEDKVRREAADAACCDVCIDAPKTHMLQPCGHYCICMSCLDMLTDQRCPVCRERFHSAPRVYDTGR